MAACRVRAAPQAPPRRRTSRRNPAGSTATGLESLPHNRLFHEFGQTHHRDRVRPARSDHRLVSRATKTGCLMPSFLSRTAARTLSNSRNRLRQCYAYHVAKRKSEGHGFRMVTEATWQDGQIHLVLRRMVWRTAGREMMREVSLYAWAKRFSRTLDRPSP